LERIEACRHPKMLYKIRQLTSGNKTGEAFGITVPRQIATTFSGSILRLVVSGNCFMFIKEEIHVTH